MSIDHLGESSSSLFQKYPVGQIQQISQELTELSNTKHEEIRNLVGSKYRDLLISADEITIMEKLSHDQDKKLYDLIFGKVKIGIDDKVKKFVQNDVEVDDNDAKIGKIQERVEFSIRLSKFLKISIDDSLKSIIEKVEDLETGYELNKEEKSIIFKKFKEIEEILKLKIIKIYDVDELLLCQDFITKRKCNFELEEFEKLLYDHLQHDLINLQNFKLILDKFSKFYQNFAQYYENAIGNLINEVQIQIKGLKPEDELKLYELKIDDKDYLLKIEYLSKGLIFKSYQDINKILLQIQEKFNYLKIINMESYNKLNTEYGKVLESFINISEDTKNELLQKYLLKLHNVSLNK